MNHFYLVKLEAIDNWIDRIEDCGSRGKNRALGNTDINWAKRRWIFIHDNRKSSVRKLGGNPSSSFWADTVRRTFIKNIWMPLSINDIDGNFCICLWSLFREQFPPKEPFKSWNTCRPWRIDCLQLVKRGKDPFILFF